MLITLQVTVLPWQISLSIVSCGWLTAQHVGGVRTPVHGFDAVLLVLTNS